jgi:hypothetical protein
MPAKDAFHDQVKNALLKDGWAVTDDPLRLDWDDSPLYIDLGAERLLLAEKGEEKIAVEIKSFLSKSEIEDLKNAIGQFVLYRAALEEQEPERKLFLAVRETVYQGLFTAPKTKALCQRERINFLVFNPLTEEVVTWIV